VAIEYFLYTANFTFPVVLLILGRWVSSQALMARRALGVFLPVLALNNLDIMRRVISYNQ
jgi:hypothetical protein